NPQSKAFVKDFEAAYGRRPTDYAAIAYDTAHLIGSGLKAVNGDLSREDDFRAALRKADFTSLRGNFKFNTNQHPIQDYYLMQFKRNEQGKLRPVVVKKVVSNDKDPFASQCKL